MYKTFICDYKQSALHMQRIVYDRALRGDYYYMKYKSSVVIVLAILLLCLISYLVPSLKIESSENRTLATFHMILYPEADSVVYHESPVERLDAALSDQFPFRELVVKKYLSLINVSENFTYGVVKLFVKQQDNQYVLYTVGNYELIEDTGYITVRPTTDPMDAIVVQKRTAQLKYLHKRYPDLKMYTYYVSQAFDMPWFNSCIGATAADHYQEIVNAIPDYVKSDHLVYQNLDDYMNIHYKTDHHWNNRGARRGYEDIYAMISRDFDLGEMCVPIEENTVSETYNFAYLGSYGKSLGELYNEGYDSFSFYEYDLPQRKMAIINPDTLEEIEAVKIGLYDEYQRGEINTDIGTDHYITMFGIARDKDGNGYDDGSYPFIIRNNMGGYGKNLIITGDSYDRAVRDVLASHFDTTVYLDYRTLSKVPIDYIIEKYDIDILLISSHTSMWSSEEYLFTFEGDE